MNLLVVQLSRAVDAIGPRLQLVLDQLAYGFERRLYSDWDAPVYTDRRPHHLAADGLAVDAVLPQ
jgi:hypothetical protein